MIHRRKREEFSRTNDSRPCFRNEGPSRIESPDEKEIILRSLPELINYQNKNHRILWANKAALDSERLTAEQIYGRRCHEVWLERDDVCPGCPVQESWQTGEARKREVITSVGRTLLVQSFPVLAEEKVVLGVVEVIRDITERKKEEEVLRESEERYQALFDRSLLCVYVHDLRGRFIDANQAALNLLGYTREEITSLTFASLLNQTQLPQAFRVLDEILKTGSQKHPAEFMLRKKDGSSVWVETEASLIIREGQSLAIQGIARDITDRKRAEEELRASLQEKEALLREIHHRVKNNLQVISSMLDMRMMRTADRKLVDLCQDARAKIQTMALIHTHIYQSGTFSHINMRDYLQDLVSYLGQVYSEKRRHVLPVIGEVNVCLSVTQAIPLAIILNEAISNAFKHAYKKGQKGTVEIYLTKASEDMVRLCVKDYGVGLPEGLDIHKAQTLGLKLIRNLVKDQLKGSLRVSREGGTEINIDFKVGKEEEKNGQDPGR